MFQRINWLNAVVLKQTHHSRDSMIPVNNQIRLHETIGKCILSPFPSHRAA